MNPLSLEIFRGERLVILGCGYVGSAVAHQALDAGLKVVAVSRNEQKLEHLRQRGAETVVADLDSTGWYERVTGEAKLVLNCVSSAGGGLTGYQRSYVDGQRAVVEWARQRKPGPERCIFTGATSVYPQTGKADVDENASTDGCGDNGRLLLESEAILREGAAVFSQATVLRLAGIYGPGRHYLLDAVREGRKVMSGQGDYLVNLIHRDDICKAIWLAFMHGPEEPFRIYNIADGNPATRQEMTRWLAEQAGAEPPRFDPDAAGERAQRRANSRGELPDRRIVADKAREELGWSPHFPTYQDGFRAILESPHGNA